MKKLFVYVLILLFIIPSVALGYEGAKYSIEIPEGFEATTVANSFNNANGNNINIQITEDNSGSIQFTEEYLNALTKELTDNIDEYREEVKKELIEQYNGQVENSVIEEAVKSIKYKDFVKKEVISFGQDNYLGFHYISDIIILDKDSYTDTYQTVYNGTIYTITVTSGDLDFFETDSIKQAISSFKIKDYVPDSEVKLIDTRTQETKGDLAYSTTERVVFIVVIIGIIFGFVGMIKKSKEKRVKMNKEDF